MGLSGGGWIEPFLRANRHLLARMDIKSQVRPTGEIKLVSGSKIGAIPLLSPVTRRVAAGLLIVPRFRWTGLGSVLDRIGYSVEPRMGGAPMVPGSSREVPAWLIAAPVLKRLGDLLGHQKRSFVEQIEERESPRGRIDWLAWGRRNVPAGRWHHFRCSFSDPDYDREMMAAVRWTLDVLERQLTRVADQAPGRALLTRTRELSDRVPPGPSRQPDNSHLSANNEFVAQAVEAMRWVSDGQGLGGDGALHGIAWDLSIDELWEAWVANFVAELAPTMGLRCVPRGSTRQRINWFEGAESMGSLAPDTGLRGPERTIWVDAKYKRHLAMLRRHGWRGLDDELRGDHRADLHQALAYTNIAQTDRVDTVLAYPELTPESATPAAIATISAGRRRVRLILAALPFGFRNPQQKAQTVERWRGALR